MTMTVGRRIGVSAAIAVSIVLLASAQGYDQQLKVLAAPLSERLASSGKKNVAVVDFTDLTGNTTELGRFLAEELSVDLAMVAKGFRVIDRTHLKAILQENKLAATGVIDPQTARKLGQIAGVEALVTGTVTPFGDSVRLTVKVLDTATAEMLTATNTDIPKTKAVEELLAKGIGGTFPVGTQPLAVPASNANSPLAIRAPAGAMQQSGAGYTFSLQSCRRSSSSVTCSGTIVNQDSDGSVSVESRVFDDGGSEHRAGRYMFAGRDGQNDGQTVAGVPVRFSISFDQVSTGSGALPVLELEGWGSGNQRYKIQFRNVPVQ